MKARIKDTGEIVTLKCLNVDGTAIDTRGRFYHQGHILEFIEEGSEPIDWEQRRYEIAKEAMNGLLSAPVGDGVNPNPSFKDIATFSVMLADELIAELKKGNE
jgi:hypothetical protein|nr:MAG TPA: hypothetical protein [Caudoviricetes sp.]